MFPGGTESDMNGLIGHSCKNEPNEAACYSEIQR